MDLSNYYNAFITYLREQDFKKEPLNLYEPIDYILQLGGKRIRPILTLLACDILCKEYQKALPAAIAIETFHNFTLVHDDIMDEAPLRRGKETVHEKWNLNTGILSGDTMLILAYQYFENYNADIFQKLAKLFSKTALEVCDGQQLDVDFETRNDVTIDEYIEMIRLKTSVLIGASLQMGAIVAESTNEEAEMLYEYGVNLGIAFQLQDDYLDTFGNPDTFGKQVGGDIIENKKTFLYLKTLTLCSDNDKNTLTNLYSQKLENNEPKINSVKEIFTKCDISIYTKTLIEQYTNKAFKAIEKLAVSDDTKQQLISFGNNLMNRNV